MNIDFEELDYQATPLGALVLRRRFERTLGVVVHEIKLGDAFLMSSLFTASEIALARLGLASLVPAGRAGLDVVVGGLGLGCTAAAVLEDPRVSSLHVVELLAPVIEWHHDGLLPLGPTLTGDKRCRFVQGDFFALAASAEGFLPETPACLDAILLDIDHAPDFVLAPAHAAFYTRSGLTALARHLRPGGVFGLWSNDPPSEDMHNTLAEVFARVEAHVVSFPNPYLRRDSACTVYVASMPGPDQSSSATGAPAGLPV
jgi:spermidine synthase